MQLKNCEYAIKVFIWKYSTGKILSPSIVWLFITQRDDTILEIAVGMFLKVCALWSRVAIRIGAILKPYRALLTFSSLKYPKNFTPRLLPSDSDSQKKTKLMSRRQSFALIVPYLVQLSSQSRLDWKFW